MREPREDVMRQRLALYGRHDELSDLSVWPRATARGGFWILSWRQKGAALSAFSDLDPEEIEGFRSLWT